MPQIPYTNKFLDHKIKKTKTPDYILYAYSVKCLLKLLYQNASQNLPRDHLKLAHSLDTRLH